MKYGILGADGFFSGIITSRQNIRWDDDHICPVQTLTADERAAFRVVEITEMQPPAYDALTQTLTLADPGFADGGWTDRWVVADCTPEQISATREAATAAAAAMLSEAVQAHLDAAAVARKYDSALSACSYAGAPNPYQAEAQAFVAWRGAVWAACHTMLGEFQAGARGIPTAQELIALLPALQ